MTLRYITVLTAAIKPSLMFSGTVSTPDDSSSSCLLIVLYSLLLDYCTSPRHGIRQSGHALGAFEVKGALNHGTPLCFAVVRLRRNTTQGPTRSLDAGNYGLYVGNKEREG